MRICMYCHADIPPTRGTAAKFCSDLCRSRSWRRANHERSNEVSRQYKRRRHLPAPPQGRCAVCASVIPRDRRRDALFCSNKCRVKAQVQRNPERWSARFRNWRESQDESWFAIRNAKNRAAARRRAEKRDVQLLAELAR